MIRNSDEPRTGPIDPMASALAHQSKTGPFQGAAYISRTACRKTTHEETCTSIGATTGRPRRGRGPFCTSGISSK